MRRFVVFGNLARADGAFSLLDLPGTSGRVDILARAVRGALLVAHGMRRDVVVYLVLGGGELAPRTVRIDGAARFIRPDERALAVLLQKTLAARADEGVRGFAEHKPGIAIGRGGVDLVLDDVGDAKLWLLDERGDDLRDEGGIGGNDAFFLGDHVGIDGEARAALVRRGAKAVRVGPVSLHTDDVVSVVQNELDRRQA